MSSEGLKKNIQLRMSRLTAGVMMLAVVMAGGAILGLAGAVETGPYVLGAKRVTELANPPKVGKMSALGMTLFMTGIFWPVEPRSCTRWKAPLMAGP